MPHSKRNGSPALHNVDPNPIGGNTWGTEVMKALLLTPHALGAGHETGSFFSHARPGTRFDLSPRNIYLYIHIHIHEASTCTGYDVQPSS